MDFYTANLILIVCGMAIMIVSICLNSSLNKSRKLYSILLVALIAICGLCEWAGIQLQKVEYSETVRILHILVKFFEFSLAPFVGFLPGLIFRKEVKKLGIIDYVALGILGINIIFEFVSCFTGIVFNVSSSNGYSHGNLYFVYYVTYIIAIIYFVYTSIKAFRNRNIKYLIPNYLVTLFIAVGVLLHLFYNDIRVEWLTLSISAVLIFKFYGDVLSNTDGLTDLLNRIEFDNTINNLSKNAVIIYFDVNHFKHVNDEYGHVYGDEVLKKVGVALRKAYGRYGKAYRYGGDEFCVIITHHREKVDELNNDFSSIISKYMKEDSKFPNVSYGKANFDPKKDVFIDVLDKADDEMYKNKEELEKNN